MVPRASCSLPETPEQETEPTSHLSLEFLKTTFTSLTSGGQFTGVISTKENSNINGSTISHLGQHVQPSYAIVLFAVIQGAIAIRNHSLSVIRL